MSSNGSSLQEKLKALEEIAQLKVRTISEMKRNFR